ncbi:MAG: light-harvesting protein [Acetobacteraceae bacterium]|nr:light-harvesting protein [Acetobacteraceae bacterium]MCX7684460.1 light-harvesting protein [Acetobacteraceae bacterium]
MNNGRIWCVVKPTVGLPLFLGGVTVIALLVHASVLTNTTWMADYWKGSSRTRAADATTEPVQRAATQAPAGFTVSVTPVAAAEGTAFVVTITPTNGTAPQSVTVSPSGGPLLASAETR